MARYCSSTDDTFDSFLKTVTNSPFDHRSITEFLNYNNVSNTALSTGIVNCVDGKTYISDAFKDVYDKMRDTKIKIELQTVILETNYSSRVEAHFWFSNPASPDKISAKLTLQRESVNLSGSPIARFHIEEMFNLIRDYFVKRDRSWTGNRMSYMRSILIEIMLDR
jgi:hypothetical protein